MAARIEYEKWKSGSKIKTAFSKAPKSYTKKPKISSAESSQAQDMFKDLFGDNA